MRTHKGVREMDQVAQDHLRDGIRSCATCFEYTREHRGETRRCRVRANTVDQARRLRPDYGYLINRRASQCQTYNTEEGWPSTANGSS